MHNVENGEQYLFQKMEAERAKIPYVLRNDYLPVFVVKCLQEKLIAESDRLRNEDQLRSKNPFMVLSSVPTMQEDSVVWSENTLLEDNPDFEGLFLLSSQENLNYVGKVLKFAKSALECFRLNRNKIGRYFTDEFEYPCLELLYLMDSVYSILPLNCYLLWLKEASQILYFKQQFLSFAFSPIAFSEETHERSNRILLRFLQCIILTHYCNPCSKPDLKRLKDTCGEILKLITVNLISEKNAHDRFVNCKTIFAMLKEVDIPNSVRTRYTSEHLNIILRSGKTPFLSGMEILQYQEKYADPTTLLNLETFNFTVSQMISMLRTTDISSIISSTLASSDFNWERMLNFITVWVQEKQNSATSILKDLSKTLIRNGLENRNEIDVLKGFIIARHCSVIASEAFSRYEKWFTNMFTGETYSLAHEAETFKFFIEIIFKWIPVEPSCFLHVHTTFWPFIPKGCRDLWSDYLSVAKTRISEYKEVEEAMEFEPNPNDLVQHEVGMAIKTFESRGKIPPSIIQMYIFSRHHYNSVFLPALLRKPTNVALTDSRLRLIELLKRDGKIPDDLYSAYKLSAKTKEAS